MTVAEDLARAVTTARARVVVRLSVDEEGERLLDVYADALQAQLQHEADVEHADDLEFARLASYRFGVCTVVDTMRSRLQATNGVPSRAALEAFLHATEVQDGGRG